jgi:asparagine synthase (glutamine-hydrolysing)
MCGIAGDISWDSVIDVDRVASMVGRLRHRGPDDSGVWSSPDHLCTLGHARLSIVDLSSGGHQPMTDPASGNTIVFNGEIYNYQQRRAECERDGFRFRSQSDTEVILALYQRYGRKCVHKLRGMFAFALYDAAKRELFVARDRVGKKPLYYSQYPGGFVFASELDSLARNRSISRDVDAAALDLYFQLQYIPAPWTIYRDIRKLPPASFAVCTEAGVFIEQYWDVDYRDKIVISEEDALDTLEEKLRESVRLRMIADVPIGALLSGGVDSSLVVALMAGLTPSPVETFSIGFDDQKFSELPFAQAVATRYRTEHHPEIVQGEVATLLPAIVRGYGEPFADSSAVPSFRVAQSARRHVKVVMNGDGGDELLGGYPRYSLPARSIRSGRWLGRHSTPRKLVRSIGEVMEARGVTGRLRRKWLLRVSNPELQSVAMYADFWSDSARARLLGVSGQTLEDWRAAWVAGASSHGDNAIDRMLWIDNRTYLAGDLLVKMDIATMHCGLESRSPLLDHEIIEFCASLPIGLKVKDGIGKYLLKRLAERYLPRELIYRPKMGFGIPLATWLRGPLASLVRDTLADGRAPEPLDRAVVTETLIAFSAGGQHASRVWALLMYALWRRHVAEA